MGRRERGGAREIERRVDGEYAGGRETVVAEREQEEAARARARDFGSARSLSRTRDYKHTRRVGSLDGQAGKCFRSYAETTCRRSRREPNAAE